MIERNGQSVQKVGLRKYPDAAKCATICLKPINKFLSGRIECAIECAADAPPQMQDHSPETMHRRPQFLIMKAKIQIVAVFISLFDFAIKKMKMGCNMRLPQGVIISAFVPIEAHQFYPKQSSMYSKLTVDH